MGFTSWIAFFYIGWRTRRVRWLLWGLLYFAAFTAVAAIATFGTVSPGSRIWGVATGLMVVAGIVSAVHAFAIRGDYLVRLENRMQEVAEADERTRRRLEDEHETRTGSPPDEEPKQTTPSDSSENDSAPSKPEVERKEVTAPNSRNADRRIRRGQRGLWP